MPPPITVTAPADALAAQASAAPAAARARRRAVRDMAELQVTLGESARNTGVSIHRPVGQQSLPDHFSEVLPFPRGGNGGHQLTERMARKRSSSRRRM